MEWYRIDAIRKLVVAEKIVEAERSAVGCEEEYARIEQLVFAIIVLYAIRS